MIHIVAIDPGLVASSQIVRRTAVDSMSRRSASNRKHHRRREAAVRRRTRSVDIDGLSRDVVGERCG